MENACDLLPCVHKRQAEQLHYKLRAGAAPQTVIYMCDAALCARASGSLRLLVRTLPALAKPPRLERMEIRPFAPGEAPDELYRLGTRVGRQPA